MLLSYIKLMSLVNKGVIKAPIENINGASIDITLGDTIYIEVDPNKYVEVDLLNKQTPYMQEIKLTEYGYSLLPGMFCLASTREVFNLPNNIACEYKLKSSLARAGLNHALAGWCDPTWYNSVLTLELSNQLQFHNLKLTPGMKIGQMVFFECDEVPEEHAYVSKGQYNNDSKAQQSKGLK